MDTYISMYMICVVSLIGLCANYMALSCTLEQRLRSSLLFVTGTDTMKSLCLTYHWSCMWKSCPAKYTAHLVEHSVSATPAVTSTQSIPSWAVAAAGALLLLPPSRSCSCSWP